MDVTLLSFSLTAAFPVLLGIYRAFVDLLTLIEQLASCSRFEACDWPKCWQSLNSVTASLGCKMSADDLYERLPVSSLLSCFEIYGCRKFWLALKPLSHLSVEALRKTCDHLAAICGAGLVLR